MGFLDIKEELLGIAFDPNQVQIDLYSHMEKLLNGSDIVDPTNPFMFLLESNATIGSVLLEQMKTNLRKLYPVLAKDKNDLYHHVYNREIENIFAYPSDGSFTFSIPVQQILQYGTKHPKYYELTIPTYTRVIVKNFYKYTVLNDIVIKYYPSTKKTLVITMPSELSIGYIGNEILTSYIVTDNNNLEWLIFNVTLKQIDGKYINEPVVPTNGYNKDIVLNDQFYTLYSRATSNVLGTVELIPAFSEFVYDVTKPIVKCKLKDNKTINVSLYDIFLETSNFNRIEFLIFDTKGKLNTNFSNISKDDFTLDFSLVKDIKKEVGSIASVNTIVFSNANINGGRNMLTTKELKEIIVNNTTGDNILPITSYDLREKASRLGYTFKEDLDSVLRRNFIVSKDLTESDDDYVYANPDLFLDTLHLTNEDVTNLPDKIKFNNGNLVIEPFTFFYKNNTTFKPVQQSEVDRFKSASLSELKTYLKDKKYFYNIYKYICDYKDYINYRIYEVNTPKINYFKSVFYNKELSFKLGYVDKFVKRIDNEYIVTFLMDMGDDIKDLIDQGLVKSFFKFTSKSSNSSILIDGEFDTNVNSIKFKFKLDSYIDSDDKCILKEFISDLDVVKIGSELSGKIYIYTTDNAYSYTDSKYADDIIVEDSEYAATISVFDVTFNLYTRINYLYSNYRISPTLREYKKYTEDVYLTYEEDVYAKDENGNYIIEDVEWNGTTVKRIQILHHKGDTVYDDNGNPIIKYKAGDIMLDENNRPIVDYQFGYEHFIDILTFELEFLLIQDQDYKNFIITKYLELNTILLSELKQLNSELLENTVIMYKPKHNLKDVKVYINDIVYNTSAFIKPKITLYVLEDINDVNIYTSLLKKINRLLQQAFNRFNNRIDINNYILNNLNFDNVEYVKIENIDTIGELNVYNYATDSNYFVIDKKIDYNSDSIFIPQLDFDLELVKI